MVEPRWPPASLTQLQSALDNGLLVESHFLDLKRELGPSPTNVGLAIDLAAFSVDGGVIFIGVDEATSPPSIYPVPLAGLAERIEQIGLSSVDPPVRIRTHEIETTLGSGVLVVIVPISPAAPHMVEGKYRGRNDKTNYVMQDAEVMRVRGEREHHQDDVERLLTEFAEAAIRVSGGRPLLLGLASPAVMSGDLVLRCAAGDPFGWISTVLLKGPLSRRLKEGWTPDFLDGLPVEPRANGWAISRDKPSTLDLEVLESGVLRLRATDLDYAVLNSDPTVNDIAVNGLIKRLVLAAGAIGAACSHYGSWDFAISLLPLRNRHAESARRTLARPMPPYSEDAYVQTTSATYEELQDDPGAVVERLLGRLNRSFGGPEAIVP